MNSNAQAVLWPIHHLPADANADSGLDFVKVFVFASASASTMCFRSALRFASSASTGSLFWFWFGFWFCWTGHLTFCRKGGAGAATFVDSVSRQGLECCSPKTEMEKR